MTNTTYKTIGIMSGTSLDGLDIAYCEFFSNNNHWNFTIGPAQTISYDENWINLLKTSFELNGRDLIQLHNDYGKWIGNEAKKFIANHQLTPDFIASHGHTIFHEPDKGITFQLGSGFHIAAATGMDVIFDFRSLDVALNGEGAPLVPVGDKLLFKDYDYCLNLGGIANASFESNHERISYDICPCNMGLNFVASKKNLPYDKDGEWAKKGKIAPELLKSLNNLPFYQKSYPKSLGREWFEIHFLPLINQTHLSIEDLLRTIIEHIAMQIAKIPSLSNSKKLLVTGGGAHNKFLIDRISKNTTAEIIIPSKKIIDYKEAMVFAFLGVLRYTNQNNCLKSVTGSKADNSGGAMIKAASF